MEATASNIHDQLFPPVEQNWVDKLFIAGLMIYAFSSSFSIAASQIGLGLALIAFIALYRAGKVNIKSTSFDSPYAFLVLTGVMASFCADFPIPALNEIRNFLIITCLYLAFWPNLKNEFCELLLKIYIASSALVALFAGIRMFQNYKDGLHAQGFFSTSITFGECQTLAAVTLMFYLVSSSLRLKRRLLLSAALLLVTTAAAFSFTRGAWLGFASGCFVIMLGFPRKTLPLLVLLAIFAVTTFNFSPYVRERIAGLNIVNVLKFADKSFDSEFETIAERSSFHRLYIWQRGFAIMRTNPCFGVGGKNIKHRYNIMANDYERQNGLVWNHQHNNFMQMLVAFGFLGLIAFLYFAISIFKFILNVNQEASLKPRQAHLGALAIFICFMTFGLTENAWGDEEVGMMAFFLTGLLLSQSQGSDLPA